MVTKQKKILRNLAATTRRRRRLRWLLRLTVIALVLSLLGLSGFLINSYRAYAKLVDERIDRGYQTSRAGIYAAPRVLRAGQKYSPARLAEVLRRAGYIESDSASEVWSGSFSMTETGIDIRANNIDTPSVINISFDADGRIGGLTRDGFNIESFTLSPESLTDGVTKGSARRQLSFSNIPPVLVHAITSIEDRRFFDHHGVDVFGITRALLRNAGDERIGQGGSTITQQLVKNTYLTPERTLRRKFAEAMLSFTLERRLSKDDIFALYCNEVFLGQRGVVAVRGVDQAARVYFGKELKDLTLAEAATIAGTIQSPTRYSPIRQNDAARARRNTVLGTMVRDGFITLDEAATAAQEPMVVADFDPARESVAPYFIDYASRLRTTSDSDRSSSPTVREGSEAAPVITSLDLDLQTAATEAISHQLARLDQTYKTRSQTPQAALVALDPRSGKVLAMIGGRNYAESQLNRATDAQRQPGSVFKPFVYAAALESGMSPLRMFRDAPQEFTYARTQKYRPSNYGGGFSMRDVPMRDALIKSLNVVTVDVAMQTGLARVANISSNFGLPRPNPYPALALGTTEATPMQIAAAYASFANAGRKITPALVSTDVASFDGQIITPATAYMITDMLQGVIDHGTARAARNQIAGTAIAGKTGTSRDGWFVGYTPNLVCAVWIGFDDNQQLGLTGAEAALPAWVEFMKTAIDLRPELGGKSFEQPEGITTLDIDPETDEIASYKCPMHERVAMLLSQAPKSECFRHNFYFDGGDATDLQARSVNPPPASPARKRERSDGRIQLSLYPDTQTEKDKRGRSVLVNEMRVAGR
jgi:penicillin-binding protein 1B